MADLHPSYRKSGSKLFHGQAQRVSLARTLANDAELLLFDDPTSALDPISMQNVEDVLVNKRNNQGMTVFWFLSSPLKLGFVIFVLKDG
ncbi:unnamed protein product [Linum trigynum]|uniref:ABC transporter domain-containing protein n=1 Tax=Linum trigynum TaxID=586398 RepID=A0AAV2E0T5_9ROSI